MNESNPLKKQLPPAYERPDLKFRCGREAFWRESCPNGPKPDGACGGVADCKPVKKGDRFQCSRPASAGGPCTEGPKPDGFCSHTHPPCLPRLTLRALRGRLVLLAAILTVAAILTLFRLGREGLAAWNSLDPGPLSARHAHLIKRDGCAVCHTAHAADATVWLKAAFTPADVTTQCLICHSFGGPERKPHNQLFTGAHQSQDTDCAACHAEHKGSDFAITRMADARCNDCHRIRFTSFSRGHPPFKASFPYDHRGVIKFNHATHLAQHFKDPKYAGQAPNACAGCHDVSMKSNGMKTLGFDRSCAGCHAEQISQNDLIFLRIPGNGPFAGEEVASDDATAVMAWMLEGAANDPQPYPKRLEKLVQSMAHEGVSALNTLFQERSGAAPDPTLLATLGSDLVTRPAQTWVSRQAYKPAAKAPGHGWFWAEDMQVELRYKPTGHADPVVQAWLKFSLAARTAAGTAGHAQSAGAFWNELADPVNGVGRCMKCHAVGDISAPKGSSRPSLEWQHRETKARPHTRFSHDAHKNVAACAVCHVLDQKADFDTRLHNFQAIQKETCMACHAEQKVRQDCQLCHEYHRAPALRKPTVPQAAK